MSITLNVTFEGIDFWSRCVVKTEKGTRLCDINCHDEDTIRGNPQLGHWHTMTPDWEEPDRALSSDVIINIMSARTQLRKCRRKVEEV